MEKWIFQLVYFRNIYFSRRTIEDILGRENFKDVAGTKGETERDDKNKNTSTIDISNCSTYLIYSENCRLYSLYITEESGSKFLVI